MNTGEILYVAAGVMGESIIIAATDWSDRSTQIASGVTIIGTAVAFVVGGVVRQIWPEWIKYKRESIAMKRDEDALYEGSYRKKLDDAIEDLKESKADRGRLEAQALEMKVRLGVLESEKQSWTLDQVTARRTTITNTQAPVSGESPAIVPPAASA